MTPSSPGVRRIAAATIALALSLALGGCASGSSQAPATGGGGQAPAGSSGGTTSGSDVTIQNFSFGPTSITVTVGSTVTWTNRDSPSHTVTADDGSFDSKAISSGSTFKQTFAKAGTFAYHCAIHPSMKGTVVVQ